MSAYAARQELRIALVQDPAQLRARRFPPADLEVDRQALADRPAGEVHRRRPDALVLDVTGYFE